MGSTLTISKLKVPMGTTANTIQRTTLGGWSLQLRLSRCEGVADWLRPTTKSLRGDLLSVAFHYSVWNLTPYNR